jgi:hypothetical protein
MYLKGDSRTRIIDIRPLGSMSPSLSSVQQAYQQRRPRQPKSHRCATQRPIIANKTRLVREMSELLPSTQTSNMQSSVSLDGPHPFIICILHSPLNLLTRACSFTQRRRKKPIPTLGHTPQSSIKRG